MDRVRFATSGSGYLHGLQEGHGAGSGSSLGLRYFPSWELRKIVRISGMVSACLHYGRVFNTLLHGQCLSSLFDSKNPC